jgi:hypothetical protein
VSDKPRDLTLERVNRLTQAVADLGESHAAQGRMIIAQLAAIRSELATLNASMRDVAGEQALLGNRVENAFSRALRANIRLDEIEDGSRPEVGG